MKQPPKHKGPGIAAVAAVNARKKKSKNWKTKRKVSSIRKCLPNSPAFQVSQVFLSRAVLNPSFQAWAMLLRPQFPSINHHRLKCHTALEYHHLHQEWILTTHLTSRLWLK